MLPPASKSCDLEAEWREAELEVDHGRAAGCFGGFEQRPRIGEIGGEGLVAEHVLAGGEGGSAVLQVQVRGRVDGDRVDFGAVEEGLCFVGVEGDLQAGCFGCCAFGTAAPECGDLPACGAKGVDGDSGSPAGSQYSYSSWGGRGHWTGFGLFGAFLAAADLVDGSVAEAGEVLAGFGADCDVEEAVLVEFAAEAVGHVAGDDEGLAGEDWGEDLNLAAGVDAGGVVVGVPDQAGAASGDPAGVEACAWSSPSGVGVSGELVGVVGGVRLRHWDGHGGEVLADGKVVGGEQGWRVGLGDGGAVLGDGEIVEEWAVAQAGDSGDADFSGGFGHGEFDGGDPPLLLRRRLPPRSGGRGERPGW